MRPMIKLESKDFFYTHGVSVPGNLWAERPFKFNPSDFVVGGDRLQEKMFLADVQATSLERFVEDPEAAIIYGVASAPNDSNAKVFAAYLVQTYLQHKGHARVKWEQLYGDFSNKSLSYDYDLLVITGLTPNSTNVKLEKARDLLEHHCDIPRIVVIAGEDPITYFSTRLYKTVNNIYYHSSKLVKSKIEVV
jgi:hypothetical protein